MLLLEAIFAELEEGRRDEPGEGVPRLEGGVEAG